MTNSNLPPEPKSTPSESNTSKLLSIVITGRDDDYMLDFKYRITTTINYIARNLKRLGRLDDVEILVTDWGSEVPLAHTLCLSPEAGRICRFLYVPPAVTHAVQDGREDFHLSFAMNASLRRACGEFLMVYPVGTLITQHGLEAMLDLLGGDLGVPICVDHTYFFCSRYRVPWEFVQHQPDLNEWDRYLLLNAGHLRREEAALSSLSKGSGALLMHRSLWHNLRGFDERLASWGWHEVELALRVTEYHPWVELSSLGTVLFHMDHSPFGRRALVIRQNPNPRIYNVALQINDENWGLGNYELEVQIAQDISTSEESPESFTSSRETDSQEVASWRQSRQEVLAELTSDEVRDHVRRIIELFLTDQAGWDIDSGDVDSLFFLSWYGRYHYPRRYLEFGIGQGYAAAVVADACPSVEIYGIDRWEGVLQRHTPLAVARVLRRSVGHHGYVRFTNGDISTAVQRLRDSFVGTFFFDLVLVRGDYLLEADTARQVSELLRALAPGGALVLACNSADSFQSLWNEVRRRFPQFSYFQCKNRKTGMVLAASLRDDHLKGTMDDVCVFETNLIWADVNLKMWQLRRLCNALKKPTRYPEYVGRVYSRVRQKVLCAIGVEWKK